MQPTKSILCWKLLTPVESLPFPLPSRLIMSFCQVGFDVFLINCIAFLVGGMDGNIKIFSNSTYQLLHTIEGHAMPIRSITFSPDSRFMMSASDDGHIKGFSFVLAFFTLF